MVYSLVISMSNCFRRVDFMTRIKLFFEKNRYFKLPAGNQNFCIVLHGINTVRLIEEMRIYLFCMQRDIFYRINLIFSSYKTADQGLLNELSILRKFNTNS